MCYMKVESKYFLKTRASLEVKGTMVEQSRKSCKASTTDFLIVATFTDVILFPVYPTNKLCNSVDYPAGNTTERDPAPQGKSCGVPAPSLMMELSHPTLLMLLLAGVPLWAVLGGTWTTRLLM